MDRFPQMLYRAPGAEDFQGNRCATVIVNDAAEHAEARADGWHESPVDAVAAHKQALADAAAAVAEAAEAAKLADAQATVAAAKTAAKQTKAG